MMTLQLPSNISAPLLLKAMQAEWDLRRSRNRLREYRPYSKQAEFHAAGATFRERLFLGGNRVGKTQCGAAEMAFHLTGGYPDWWAGKRFDKPVRAWAAGVTSEATRDVVQEKLIGPAALRETWGTGMIPHAAIGDVTLGRGVPNAIDTVSIKHRAGGFSTLAFKSYERGREKWQGAALEVLWMDEEPPEDIYFEALTRTNETGGTVFITCTPLLGMSSIMQRFLMGS
jgi:phage terminase large subunit-like protein